ncbi:MAG: hypothetical protein JOY89_00300 [Solirubrobacterales bacterium]|nr:hypothetical protein [Solirubrobacterales bacterium]
MTMFGSLSFHEPLWVYISIPVAAALVGWFTKIVAVKMIFYPIEFKGIPPYLGWQGQIPSHAAKMASIAMDSITTTVLKPDELFARIDPDELTRELEGPLHEAAEEIVDGIMVEYQPRLWAALPAAAKRAVIANVERRAPTATRNMLTQLSRNLDQVFDLKHVVVSNLVHDKRVLNRMFQEAAGDAFKFLIRSGFYFGFCIGLIQVTVFGITGWHLVLPLFGLITGGLTDYIALTMIFRPKQEKWIAPGIRWQGLFHNRREQITRDYSALLAKDIITPVAILDSLLTGPMSDKFYEMIRDEIQKTIDEQTGVATQLIVLSVGSRKYTAMKKSIAERVIEKMPEASYQAQAYAAERLDIEDTIIERMRLMDINDYENLLRPAFKDDEWIIVALGATLGFLFGEIQVQIITHLAS